jgi:hypothetical protein
MTSDNYLSTTSNDESPLTDQTTCCHLHSKSNDQQVLSTIDEVIEEPGIIYAKCKHKNDLTCARFYEEKIRAMLEICSKVIEIIQIHRNQ